MIGVVAAYAGFMQGYAGWLSGLVSRYYLCIVWMVILEGAKATKKGRNILD